jgi:bis(5'-nucleosyl)-tetraphosphatase (symmetrical)
MAQARALEIEAILQGDQAARYLKSMYGNQPNWSPKLSGNERFRAIVNIFTRMRYCTPNGRIGFEEKGKPGTQQAGFYPWFSVPGHAERELPIVFGHWSTLGLFMGLGVYAIDTGAVWGGSLTALELGPQLRIHQVPGRSDGFNKP